MAKKKTVKDVESVEKAKVKKAKQLEKEVEIEDIDELEVEAPIEDNKKEKKNTKSSKKEKATNKEKKDSYLKSVRKELKKVVWPKGSEIFKYTLSVIFLCIVLALFFAGVELLAAFIKGLFV